MLKQYSYLFYDCSLAIFWLSSLVIMWTSVLISFAVSISAWKFPSSLLENKEDIVPRKYILCTIEKKISLGVNVSIYSASHFFFSLIVFYAGSYTAAKTAVSEYLIELGTHQGELWWPSFPSIPSPQVKGCYVGSGWTYSTVTNSFWTSANKIKVKERSIKVMLECWYFWSFLILV